MINKQNVPIDKVGVDEIRVLLNEHELGFLVMYYLTPDDIADEKLAAMWKKAACLLWDIDEYVG